MFEYFVIERKMAVIFTIFYCKSWSVNPYWSDSHQLIIPVTHRN